MILIIGKGTQLDQDAVRYIVDVDFYRARYENDITYSMCYYPPVGDSKSINLGVKVEYGVVSIETGGAKVPVTMVRCGYAQYEAGGEFGLSINSKIKNSSQHNSGICGNDIQVSVYQMKTFLDAYDGETKTVNKEASQESILDTFKRGKYAELDKENPLSSDNHHRYWYKEKSESGQSVCQKA